MRTRLTARRAARRITAVLRVARTVAVIAFLAAAGALAVDQRGNAAVVGLLGLLAVAVVYLLAAQMSRLRGTVAELTAAEAYARDEATLLGTVVDSIGVGVLVVDEHGEVLLCNPQGRTMQGVDDQGSTDRHGVYLPDGNTPFPAAELPLARALRGQRTDHAEMVIRHPGRPDGITLSVCARPLPDQARRTGAIAVCHDITARKTADATISDLRAFTTVAAHDLKSPLTAVAGFAELLEDSLTAGADPTALRPTATRLVAGIDRMCRLVEDVLVYATARDGRIDLQPVDLNDVVTEVIAERTAHLRTSTTTSDEQPLFPDIYTGPLPVVHADPTMTRQLLDNLIGNAIKYTLPGRPARIDISAHSRHGDHDWIRVEIADRGIGIPTTEKPHIFTSYHRSTQHTRGYTGTGLGLAICQRIIDRHGAKIGVSDNPGGGTRVWFTLPTTPLGKQPADHNNRDGTTRSDSSDAAPAKAQIRSTTR